MAKCVGCGLEVNNGILEIDLVGGGTTGALTCTSTGTDQGLDIRLCPNGGIVNDSTCGLKIQFPANTVGGPSSILPLGSCLQTDASSKINTRLSSDACNGLVCRANGLYSPCPDSIAGSLITNPGLGTGSPTLMAAPGTFNILSSCNTASIPAADGWEGTTCVLTPPDGFNEIQVCNTLCCPIAGMWNVQGGGGLIVNATADFIADVELGISNDHGVSYGAFPTPIQRLQAHQAGQAFYISNLQDFNYFLLSPGVCFLMKARIQIRVSRGSATLTQVPGFEFRWHGTQVGCCPPAA